MTDTPVLRASRWATNGHLIADVARLGYLRVSDLILDPTWGNGTWWAIWAPDPLLGGRLVGTDLDLAKSPWYGSTDFTNLPWAADTFDAVAFDPPYKLNGTPTADVDTRYGVHTVTSRADRHQLILDGITECARVCRRTLLVKCQDQVNGGKVRWQTRLFADHAEAQGFELVDRFDMLGGRPQPADRRQVRVHANYSTLLVFQKGR